MSQVGTLNSAGLDGAAPECQVAQHAHMLWRSLHMLLSEAFYLPQQMLSHYTTLPFHSLPPSVIDSVFEKHTTSSLYHCSLVCKAWRHLPYTYLYQLSVGRYGLKLPAKLVHLCGNLRAIHVSSSSTTTWPPLAQQLSQQQLPSLWELHIQHSSHSSSTELQQLKHIMQVQGSKCHLYLALTDKPSLQTLLELLPIQGLAQLDLNVPYLPEGAAYLLAQAAALQALNSSTQQQCSERLQTGSLGSGPQQDYQEQQLIQNASLLQRQQPATQQHTFSIGVWVCCWGGCSGLELQTALDMHQQLRAVGCQMHGCESINCLSSSDVEQLAAFTGLKALGFNYKRSGGDDSSSGGSAIAAAVQPAAESTGSDQQQPGQGTTIIGDSSSSSSKAVQDVNTAALASLAGLANSLQQLTVHGLPMRGFSSSTSITTTTAAASGNAAAACGNTASITTCLAAATPQQQISPSLHTLAALTGLTKLSLLKQWGPQPALPISPISHLTQLCELAIERQGLTGPCELKCLSVLTGLKVLSMSLATEAEQLLEDMKNGKWLTVTMAQQSGRSQQHPQEAAAEVNLVTQLAELTVCNDASEIGRDCSCFCSSSNSGWQSGDLHADDAISSKCTIVPDPAGDNAVTAAVAEPDELLCQLCCCGLGGVSSAVLLDWSWMTRLTQLEVAWLQVPHLDLACLPSSLVELDAQQPHDLTQVSITCSGASTGSSSNTSDSGFSSSRIWLPNLKRLILPNTLQATLPTQQVGTAAAPHTDNVTVSEFCDDWDYGSNSSNARELQDLRARDALLQLHYNARLLLQLSQGCPELRELELVQWQLPSEAVVAAARQLRYLRLISLRHPDEPSDCELMQQGIRSVRDGSVTLRFQEQLVLSRYPWSSVLDQR